MIEFLLQHSLFYMLVICQVHPSGKYISMVILLSQCSLYKPTFHSSHLSHNMSCGGNATIQIFSLPWQGYSYLTQSFITELYSCQCLNTETSTQSNIGYTTKTLSIFYIISLYISIRLTKFGPNFLLKIFLFIFMFFSLVILFWELGLKSSMITKTHCYKLHNTVTKSWGHNRI